MPELKRPKEVESTFGTNKIDVTNVTCNKDKLSEFDLKYAPKYQFERNTSLYIPPCTEMESIVGSTTEIRIIKNSKTKHPIGCSKDLAVDKAAYLKIKLYYRIQHYTLASNKEAFTLFSLWSQVGGFIGIFLGYSLLQLPELLGYISMRIKNATDNFKGFSYSAESQ